MDNIGKYLLAAIVGAILALTASVVIRCTDNTPPAIIRDTTIVHDTIRIEQPIAKVVRVTDTCLVFIQDTIRMRDSVFVQIPIEQKTYADSTYKAQVSGYRPNLDWIEVYPTTTTITETRIEQVKKRTRWGIGVQVGYGAALHNKQVVLSPYVGIGLSYNLLAF